eukprot:402092_1
MAQESKVDVTSKEDESSVKSILSLVCAGSGQKYGKGKKVALKTNRKSNNVDLSKINIKNSVNLNGCDQDNATVAKYVSWYNRRNWGLMYKSKQSCCDAQLTVSSARNRIRSWLQEFKGQINKQFFLYFSGHGTEHNGGGICFCDGILYYEDLAKLFSEKSNQLFQTAKEVGQSMPLCVT